MKYFLLIPILFPMIMAIVGAKANFKSKRNRNVFLYSVVGFNLALLIEIFYQGNNLSVNLIKISSFLNIYLKVDKLGILFSLLASILWIFTTSYSIEYMSHEKDEKRFFTFFLATLGVTVGIALSGNLFTMYIFYELLTLTTFPLVIHAESKDALYSGKKYLIYSFGGATLALLGMMILYSITNNLDFIPKGVLFGYDYDKTLIMIAYTSMFIGFGVKAAVAPFHSWLPAAMVAPTPVSSLLHAVAVVKSGIFALIRVSYFVVGATVIKDINGNKYISILVVLTVLMGSFLALHQNNLKKRLAYSTISQLGYMVLGIILLNKQALTGAIMHLINHAVIKITLFFCVGAIYFKTHKKNVEDIEAIGKNMPITMWCFSIAAISLIGIPPTNAFVSKWFLALGGLNDKIIFPIIILLSAFLTAAYILPIVVTAFFHIEENEDERNLDPPKGMLIPIVGLTAIVVFLGLFPNVVLNFVKSIVSEVL